MLFVNIVLITFYLVVALIALRFVAKHVNAFLAMGLFVAGYLLLFNTLGSMFGYGLVIWAGLIGIGVMFRTLARLLGVKASPTSLRLEQELEKQMARDDAERDRIAREDAILKRVLES
jgi:signal transduction histidine kinase